MTHTADDMHDDAPMTTTAGISAEAVAGLDPDMPVQQLKLHMGEMTAQEVRTTRAAIRWANATLAAEVEALRRERDRLDADLAQCREALKPFAVYLDDFNIESAPGEHWVTIHIDMKVAEARHLCSLLPRPVEALRRERDSLAAELAQCREALEPFAEAVERDDKRATQDGYRPSFDEYEKAWFFRYGVLRRARTALKGTSHEPAILSEQGDG